MEQLQFLNKFLAGFGFNGLADNSTKISQSDVSENVIEHVNKHIPEIKKIFKIGSMNLSRKNYKIDSVNLAFSVLKHCLKQANVPFESIHTNTSNYMRLIPVNKMLLEYIAHPMNHIDHLENDENLNEPLNLSTLLDGKKITFVTNRSQFLDKQFNQGNTALMQLVKTRPIDIDAVKIKEITLYDEKDHGLKYFLTDDNIILQVHLNRFSDMMMECNFSLSRGAEYLDDGIVEKTYHALGDTGGVILCGNLQDIKKYPYPHLATPFHGNYLLLYLKRNTNIKNMCVELNTIELNRLDDFKLQYTDNTYRYLLNRNCHDFTHDANIQNIKIGIVDANNNYQLVKNHVCAIQITIGDNNVYEQYFTNNSSTGLIEIQIEEIPMTVLTYNQATIKIKTFCDLSEDHMILLQHMTNNTSYDRTKNLKFRDGYIQDGVLIWPKTIKSQNVDINTTVTTVTTVTKEDPVLSSQKPNKIKKTSNSNKSC